MKAAACNNSNGCRYCALNKTCGYVGTIAGKPYFPDLRCPFAGSVRLAATDKHCACAVGYAGNAILGNCSACVGSTKLTTGDGKCTCLDGVSSALRLLLRSSVGQRNRLQVGVCCGIRRKRDAVDVLQVHDGACECIDENSKVVPGRVETIIEMIVHIIGAGETSANSFAEYLRMDSGRPGLGDNPIHENVWKKFVKKLENMSMLHLAELFNCGFLHFWNAQGTLWVCFDESIIGFTGDLLGKIIIPRKPTPEGGLVYVLALLSASGKPIPLVLIPVFEAGEKHLSPHEVLELICNTIRNYQQEGMLKSPVCMAIDAAFGSIESLQRHYPHILFVASAPDSQYKDLLSEHLGMNESRLIHRGAVLQTMFKDVSIVYNISTFFRVGDALPVHPREEPILSKQAIELLLQFPDDDLRKLAQQCRVRQSGGKKDIVSRIAHSDVRALEMPKGARQRQKDEEWRATRAAELGKWTCEELTRHLKGNLGATVSGRKHELIKRGVLRQSHCTS
eukprot:m51a1_g12072 hypothetical protein (507) ;mRNA; r:12-6298